MSDKKTRRPVGSLKISEEVISTIASVTALEIEGVAGLGEPTPGMGKSLFQKLSLKPIAISLNDDFAEIDICLNLYFGAKIAEVCKQVQGAVKDAVQTMSGLAVGKVNVLVAGIVFTPKTEQIRQ